MPERRVKTAAAMKSQDVAAKPRPKTDTIEALAKWLHNTTVAKAFGGNSSTWDVLSNVGIKERYRILAEAILIDPPAMLKVIGDDDA